MKVEFDKALLWLVPYLYLVSVSYYWGYWGTFDIDVFNYYAVSDLVKGITAPIGSVLYFIISAIALYKFNNASDSFPELQLRIMKLKKYQIILVILLKNAAAFCLFFGIYHYAISPFTYKHAQPKETFLLLGLTLAAVGLSIYISGKFFEEENKPINWLAAAIIFLPCRSFITGKETALLTIQNREYDYIVADSLTVPQKRVYKYLGKAGEYHMLLSQDNLKRIIVPLDKLPPLVIENFSLEDSASVRRFKILEKELASTILSASAKHMQSQK